MTDAAAAAAAPASSRIKDHMQSIVRLMAIMGAPDNTAALDTAADAAAAAGGVDAASAQAAGASTGANGTAAVGSAAGGARVVQEGDVTRVVLEDRGLAARLRALQQRCRAASDQHMADAE
jgi:hypothetical protein